MLPGYVQTPVRPARQGTSTGLIIAIIVAVVLVAVCIGAAIAIAQQSANNTLGPVGATLAVDHAVTDQVTATTGKGEATR